MLCVPPNPPSPITMHGCCSHRRASLAESSECRDPVPESPASIHDGEKVSASKWLEDGHVHDGEKLSASKWLEEASSHCGDQRRFADEKHSQSGQDSEGSADRGASAASRVVAEDVELENITVREEEEPFTKDMRGALRGGRKGRAKGKAKKSTRDTGTILAAEAEFTRVDAMMSQRAELESDNTLRQNSEAQRVFPQKETRLAHKEKRRLRQLMRSSAALARTADAPAASTGGMREKAGGRASKHRGQERKGLGEQFRCELCPEKRFLNEAALETHLESTAHKRNAALYEIVEVDGVRSRRCKHVVATGEDPFKGLYSETPALFEGMHSEQALVDEADLSDDRMCAICAEPLCKPRVLVKCGHIFCQTCLLDVALRGGGAGSCPLCRQRFHPNDDMQSNTRCEYLAREVLKAFPEVARRRDHTQFLRRREIIQAFHRKGLRTFIGGDVYVNGILQQDIFNHDDGARDSDDLDDVSSANTSDVSDDSASGSGDS